MALPKSFTDAIDIVTVVKNFINVKRAGANYVACCPFHNEKTPSFNIDTNRQYYYCFGCHAKGDAIQFVIDFQKTGFVEAVRTIAEIQNLPMPELNFKDDANANLYVINKWAAQKYKSMLTKEHYAYFAERGLSIQTVDKFEIGFAVDGFDFLTKLVKDKTAPLIELGLLVQNENGKIYDRFRNRLMFAWNNGKHIGFSGRTLSTDKNEAKYINSIDSDVFKKGSSLFGMSLARKSILQTAEVCIVEGQIDVMTFHEVGIENVLGTGGTAFTENHAQTLKAMIGNEDIARAVLFFDSDAAGRKALRKTVELLFSVNVNTKVCFFPNKHDPNSYLQENGVDAWRAYVSANTLTYIDYACNEIEKLQTVEDKSKAVKGLIEIVSNIPDTIKRNFLFQQIAQRLKPHGITFEMITQVANEISVNSTKVKSYSNNITQTNNSLTDNERELISLFFIYHAEKIGVTKDKLLNWKEKFETVAEYFFFELYDVENILSEGFKEMYFFAKNCIEFEYDFNTHASHFLQNKELKNYYFECLSYDFVPFSQVILDNITNAITQLKIEIVRNILTKNSLKQLESNDVLEKTLLISEQNRLNQILEGLENILC
jgi:DNA primase catalytic core